MAASFQKLPDSAASQSVGQHSSPWTVYVSGETNRLAIGLRLAVDCVQAMFIQDKQMLVFDFIFDL
jgi:hypothetical protein